MCTLKGPHDKAYDKGASLAQVTLLKVGFELAIIHLPALRQGDRLEISLIKVNCPGISEDHVAEPFATSTELCMSLNKPILNFG